MEQEVEKSTKKKPELALEIRLVQFLLQQILTIYFIPKREKKFFELLDLFDFFE